MSDPASLSSANALGRGPRQRYLRPRAKRCSSTPRRLGQLCHRGDDECAAKDDVDYVPLDGLALHVGAQPAHLKLRGFVEAERDDAPELSYSPRGLHLAHN
eukprot:1775359-Pleurochrysis_carterae.AAC.4